MKHNIQYRLLGERGPLHLLLYGYGGKPQHWQSVAEKLSATHRVVIPHLNSLYLSKDPLFFTVQVELILQFIEENFPDESAEVTGVSYGGLLSWGMSLQRPQLFTRVNLLNPMLPSALDHVQLSELKYMLRVPFNRQTLALLLATPIGKSFLKKTARILANETPESIERIAELKGRKLLFIVQMIHHFSWILKNEDWKWWLKKSLSAKTIKVPTRLLISEDDPLFSVQTYQNFHQQQQFAEMQIISSGGHLLPLSVADAVISFLNNPALEIKKAANE